MNILFLVHRIPYPPNKGDKIRSFNELKFLAKNHSIYLGTLLDSEADRQYLNNLNKYCKDIHAAFVNKKKNILKNLFSRKPFSVSGFYATDLQKFVDRLISEGKVDKIICYCSSMAEYVFKKIPNDDSKYHKSLFSKIRSYKLLFDDNIQKELVN